MTPAKCNKCQIVAKDKDKCKYFFFFLAKTRQMLEKSQMLVCEEERDSHGSLLLVFHRRAALYRVSWGGKDEVKQRLRQG